MIIPIVTSSGSIVLVQEFPNASLPLYATYKYHSSCTYIHSYIIVTDYIKIATSVLYMTGIPLSKLDIYAEAN